MSDEQVHVRPSLGLRVVVEEPGTAWRMGAVSGRLTHVLEVSAPGASGRVVVTVTPRPGRTLTVLLDAGARYDVLLQTTPDDGGGRVTLEVARGGTLRVIVVEQLEQVERESPTRAEPPTGGLWRPDVSLGIDRPRGAGPEAAGAPPPAAALPPLPAPSMPPPAPSMTPSTPPPTTAPSPSPPVLAEVGASMPDEVHVDDAVPVEVLLSRGEVQVREGTAHDEHVIAMDPTRPLDLVVLRRGFDLDEREAPREVGRRTIDLPPGDGTARVVFWLRAADEGEGEVQVVVRQDHPLPLATLRLVARILPRRATPLDRRSAEDAVAQRPVVRRERPMDATTVFANPRSLVIDENRVGERCELSFDLVLPGFRSTYSHVVPHKTAVLTALFGDLDHAWQRLKDIGTPATRAAAFQSRLQGLGSRLAADVLPPDLLADLREHLDEIDELAVITSGETDIPWELVHVWPPDAGEDRDGAGFLGRAGLVRWVYNTGHPTDLSVRAGRAFHLAPAYADAKLVLDQAQLEPAYLQPFGAVPVTPPDATGLARLLTSGEVDLLHFAGHGFSNDAVSPPVRLMALADYRHGVEVDGDRSRVAYGLDDLRQALPDVPPLRFGEPGPLVFLNACRIGQPPSTSSESGGFAEVLLRGGAGAFVGCLWSVGDKPAKEFVAAFYDALDRGHTIAHATLLGRRAAREAGDISWLAYTVYAHPDARLADRPPPSDPDLPPTVPPAKGSSMTTTATTRKAPALTRDQLRTIHPHVISTEDGKLAEGASSLPTGVDDFRTVRADIDDLFATRLPAFIDAQGGGPVPLVLWAHGGLVNKAGGLRVAHSQVEWWLANGAFPVHFVWRTGLAESLWDAVKDNLPGASRGLDDLWDKVVEGAVRGAQGRLTWSAMKNTARLTNEKDTGGAWYFAQKLAAFTKERAKDKKPGVTVHAIGHSAGSIFHSFLVPELIGAGVPVASLDLLAPAIRVDEFKQRIMKRTVLPKIAATTIFTMSQPFEERDTCIGVYRKSLLYLIRAALEDDQDAEILGLQECLRRDPDLAGLQVVWSQTVGGGPRTTSCSTTHGGFDNDRATMNSLARRILDTDDLKAGFGTVPATRALVEEEPLWPSEAAAFAYIASRERPSTQAPGRRALCIGIDAYPSPADRLAGCVADARAWRQELQHAGFAVDVLEDEKATRQNIVEGIQDLIVRSRAGDVLVVQFAGHGTTVDDLDGDELEEAVRTGETSDEALCPVDFRDGELLIDDDLGQLWDLLPEGVSLTVFFDSCHSGGNQRQVLPVPPEDDPTTKVRLVRLAPEDVAAYREKRGSVTRASRSLDSERSVYFGACQATELAYESNGQGDFTRKALPRIRECLAGTNQQFYDAVLADFGAARRQTPVLLPPGLASRSFLAPTTAGSVVTEAPRPPLEIPPVTELPALAAGTRREQAIVQVLRGLADLIES